MHVYIITFLISLALYYCTAMGKKQYIPRKGKKGKYKIYINRVSIGVFLSSLPPMLICAFRYNVGTDYIGTYYTGFFRILDRGNVDRYEIGYYYFVKLIQLFTKNVYVLFFITSVIFVGMTYKAIKDMSVSIPFSIVMFLVSRYYFVGMNAVRQFVALAILGCSLKFVINRDARKFLMYVLLASFFHYMSFLFLPVYFLSKMKLGVKRVILWIVLDVLIFNLSNEILYYILGDTKYGLILARYEVAGMKFTICTIILNTCLFLISYCGYKRRNDDEKYLVFLNLQFFALLASLVLRTIPQMERVYWIYSFPIIFTLPYLMQGIKKRLVKRCVKYGILLVFSAYMIFDIVIMEDHEVLPYRSYIGREIIHYSGWRNTDRLKGD